MDIDTLIQNKDKTLRLTKNDRNRLQNLLNRDDLDFLKRLGICWIMIVNLNKKLN